MCAQFDRKSSVERPGWESCPVVDAQEEAPEETDRPEGLSQVLREHWNDGRLRLHSHFREPNSVAPQQFVAVVAELRLVDTARTNGQHVAVL